MKVLFNFISGAVTSGIGVLVMFVIFNEFTNEPPGAIISAFIISCMLIYTGIMLCINTCQKEMNGE